MISVDANCVTPRLVDHSVQNSEVPLTLCSCFLTLSLPHLYPPTRPTRASHRIELRALGKIAEGQELTVGYVDFLNVSHDRQKLLKQQYFFDCTCEHCSQHIKDDLMMAAKEVDGKKVGGLAPPPSLLLNITRLCKQAEIKFSQIQTFKLPTDHSAQGNPLGLFKTWKKHSTSKLGTICFSLSN